jgi:predicted P-loop ATPase/GTPase
MALVHFFRRLHKLRLDAMFEKDPVRRGHIERKIDRLLDEKNEELSRKIDEILSRIDKDYEVVITEYYSSV